MYIIDIKLRNFKLHTSYSLFLMVPMDTSFVAEWATLAK